MKHEGFNKAEIRNKGALTFKESRHVILRTKLRVSRPVWLVQGELRRVRSNWIGEGQIMIDIVGHYVGTGFSSELNGKVM